ncbi:MAG: hypothetical protein AAF483_25865, partial [Planctomycetota bacterium]
FPNQSIESAETTLVVEALIAAAEQYPVVKTMMFDYVDELVSKIAEQLKLAYPASGKSQCWSVAYGLVSLCFNQESLVALQLPPKYLKAAKANSRLLIQSLEASSSDSSST